jgi:N-acetylated-alpha-linked acidic dipeptidase
MKLMGTFLSLAGLCLQATAPEPPPDLPGFSAPAARAELAWEQDFRALPDPQRLGETVRRLSARPHHVGSPGNLANARWALARFREWGFEAGIETAEAVFPVPVERSVTLLGPRPFSCSLEEPDLAGGAAAQPRSERLPPYNAYSPDGDVTGPLVYVNYGRPEDYDRLERRGVQVRGAVVLARYGSCWRGVKPRLAAERGAVGCLIYSDPRDDGFFQDLPYPDGPARPRTGVQRGSVLTMQARPGDPGSSRENLAPIPVLPLSSGDAEPLLRALAGPVAEECWRGALPLTYRLGPGPGQVRLKVRCDWSRRTLRNVVARLPGAAEDGPWIIRGNHHDAWVGGARDPCSGAAALLEEARALGELRRRGWLPRRPVLYCLWDGEEPGLLGSTAWVQDHGAELASHGAVYLNSDENGRGLLQAGGSGCLERLVNAAARTVPDPETGMDLEARARLARLAQADPARREQLRRGWDLRLEALGSGSDYTAFLDHAGVASLDLGFAGEGLGQGQYHSAYDDFEAYRRFGDPGFRYGRALAQTAGTLVLRLAGAELLPLRFGSQAEAFRRYAGELERLAADLRAEAEERGRRLAEGAFAALADPLAPSLPPAAEPIPPHLDLAPLATAADRLVRAAAGLDQAMAGAGPDLPAGINQRLAATEGRLLDPDGLPGRPWYRHLVYAPGKDTGYAVKTFPGVREAMEARRWPEAEAQAARAARALDREAELLERLTLELGG